MARRQTAKPARPKRALAVFDGEVSDTAREVWEWVDFSEEASAGQKELEAYAVDIQTDSRSGGGRYRETLRVLCPQCRKEPRTIFSIHVSPDGFPMLLLPARRTSAGRDADQVVRARTAPAVAALFTREAPTGLTQCGKCRTLFHFLILDDSPTDPQIAFTRVTKSTYSAVADHGGPAVRHELDAGYVSALATMYEKFGVREADLNQ